MLFKFQGTIIFISHFCKDEIVSFLKKAPTSSQHFTTFPDVS